jgi:hypothetical protein
MLGEGGHQAINRALLGGGIAGLTAQGLNMMTGDPDGNDDMNVLAALAAGSGIGAASGAMGKMVRNAGAARKTHFDEAYDKMQGMGLDRLALREPNMSWDATRGDLGSDSPLAIPGAVGSKPNPNAVHPDEVVSSPLPAILQSAINGAQGTDSPLGLPGAVAVKPGTNQNSGAVVPTDKVQDIQRILVTIPGDASAAILPTENPKLGHGATTAYKNPVEARQAAAVREALEGKKKLSQGTQLKYNRKVKEQEAAKEMEDLTP